MQYKQIDKQKPKLNIHEIVLNLGDITTSNITYSKLGTTSLEPK